MLSTDDIDLAVTAHPAFCAWCIYGDGDLCTNPGSPVYPGECGPVCSGGLRCKVREVKS